MLNAFILFCSRALTSRGLLPIIRLVRVDWMNSPAFLAKKQGSLMKRFKASRFLSVILLAAMCCSVVVGQSNGRIAGSAQSKSTCACGCSHANRSPDPIFQATYHPDQDCSNTKATDHCADQGKNGCGCKLKPVTIPVHLPAIMADKYENDERQSISSASDSDLPAHNAALLCVPGHCFRKVLEQSSHYQSPTISFQGPRAPPA